MKVPICAFGVTVCAAPLPTCNVLVHTSFVPVRRIARSKPVVHRPDGRSPVECLVSADTPDSPAPSSYEDDGTRVIPVPLFLAATQEQQICGVYAVLDVDKEPVYIGMSRNVYDSLETHYRNYPDLVYYVRVMTFVIPMVREMKLVIDTWILDNEVTPVGNVDGWPEADTQLAEQAKLIPDVGEAQLESGAIISPFQNDPLANAAKKELLELSAENVDSVLDEVRPYLVSDGGNVSVIHVDGEDGRVELELEGACSSCASAATTMKLGIEKALKERFGTQLNEVVAVDTQIITDGLSVDVCEKALDPIRQTLRGLGADVVVSEVDEGEVILSFTGPNSLKYGVEKTLMEKVSGVEAVTFE
ncbi:GIY-YIG endonuclease [Gracilaria domingensis]|nr:GIY-YIG endonuclease [Gracilaria domingensis]